MGLLDKLMRRRETPSGDTESRLRAGLRKTRAILTADIGDLFAGRTRIDEEVLEELETRLLTADVGIETANAILEALRKRIGYGDLQTVASLIEALRGILKKQLALNAPEPDRDHTPPHTILVVGINGSGKTTTIGKLARLYQEAGHSVMLAAGDTFRAAAVEQLQTWGERNRVPVIAQKTGADPAAVIFDALQSARSKGIDVLLADTAGRLHTQSGLMEELKKIKRVLAKLDPGAPQETLLVLDAGIGQNALQQARQFHETIGVTGLVLTKLDGTAKGGIIFAIYHKLGLPVRYIGVGEGIDDLKIFDPDSFVDALLAQD
jgi:fused signal recognition particle receptor